MLPNRLIPPSLVDHAYHEAQLRINQMPIAILQNLNNIPSDLSQFIQTLPAIQSLEQKRTQLIEHNRQLAINNLKKEPELISARQKLSQSFAELAPLREKYFKDRSDKKTDDLLSPDLILGQLQSTAHASEEANDEMIETFSQTNHNDSNIDIFIKKFLQDRQETINLRFIAEKFFDLYQIEKRKR